MTVGRPVADAGRWHRSTVARADVALSPTVPSTVRSNESRRPVSGPADSLSAVMSDALHTSSRRTTSVAPCPTSSTSRSPTHSASGSPVFVKSVGAIGSSSPATCARRARSWSTRSSDGLLEQGVDVVDLGLASTDLMYFAAGTLDAPGAMFTASHNPAQYNGVKLCLAGARPVGVDTGLADVKRVAAGRARRRTARGQRPTCGTRSEQDLLGAFVDHVLSFIDPADIGPMRVVADTANGMGGLVVPAVFERLPGVELEVMYGELDGTFPNHPADPLQPANQRDLQARVVSGGFDLGLAFDGDADRVFVVDELGHGLSGSTTTALLAVGRAAHESRAPRSCTT